MSEADKLEDKEIEKIQICPTTIVQLQRILNCLVNNKEYVAKFGNMGISYYGDGKIENTEVFILYRNKEE